MPSANCSDQRSGTLLNGDMLWTKILNKSRDTHIMQQTIVPDLIVRFGNKPDLPSEIRILPRSLGVGRYLWTRLTWLGLVVSKWVGG